MLYGLLASTRLRVAKAQTAFGTNPPRTATTTAASDGEQSTHISAPKLTGYPSDTDVDWFTAICDRAPF